MIPILDKLEVDVACVGNHDYVSNKLIKDDGIDHLKCLTDNLNPRVPWLLSNLYAADGTQILPPGIEYLIKEYNGIKVDVYLI
jgi:2',3'-cyclic-nucleotide 2'-phosphodiesterase (5'-nucleotidase family)